jgi:hypothetical protein
MLPTTLTAPSRASETKASVLRSKDLPESSKARPANNSALVNTITVLRKFC